ncbi:T9SS type A sorting domain-containing protein [Dyadobacter sp. CY312]|uniref:T9SS type A sorting domain-containing protein n=1 Tax=Dyadobacter sp. CY312 TaxID=2907303 RepID=UPI001F4608CE|nr:T9SS type A sorting domain-containing protein [Dyadobacter sp. CY312]MCE7044640.1 T9SS type A sorting domain-containing protein [Dyadobacter sp. CY312]
MIHYLKKWVPGVGVMLTMITLSICALSGFAQCVSPGTAINFSTAGNNTTTGYTTEYVLTDDSGNILQNVSSGFLAPATDGNYKVYAVNYDTGGTPPDLSPATNISAIGGSCAKASDAPLAFCVATAINNCVTTGAPIAFSATGQNTDAGFETRYVLTDNADVIISSTNASPITAPSAEGTYKIYVVNYDTNNGNAAPTLAAGTTITDIGGDCAAISNSPLVVCVTSPLPVTLVSFTASEEGDVTLLTWSTTEETNASYFEIQRSSDAKNWNPIGKKDATGESKSTVSYSFADSAPLGGTNYYRLKLVDQDATFAYSRIQSVSFGESSSSIILYPNPASDVVKIKDLETKNVNGVTMVNMNGKTVYQSSAISPDGINVKAFSAGIYLIKISHSDGRVSTHKIVVSR